MIRRDSQGESETLPGTERERAREREGERAGGREGGRERDLGVFGWMWRVSDLRSLQNLNYLLAFLQLATVS